MHPRIDTFREARSQLSAFTNLEDMVATARRVRQDLGRIVETETAVLDNLRRERDALLVEASRLRAQRGFERTAQARASIARLQNGLNLVRARIPQDPGPQTQGRQTRGEDLQSLPIVPESAANVATEPFELEYQAGIREVEFENEVRLLVANGRLPVNHQQRLDEVPEAGIPSEQEIRTEIRAPHNVEVQHERNSPHAHPPQTSVASPAISHARPVPAAGPISRRLQQ